MLGWKAFGVSLLIMGWLQYSLVSAEKTIAVQQTEIVQYKSNNDKLESAIKTEKETIQTLLSMNEKTGERLHELTSKQQESFTRNAELNEEINNLRQTEATLALEKPYGRGNAANDRINKLMQFIGGLPFSEANSNLHNTSDAKD